MPLNVVKNALNPFSIKANYLGNIISVYYKNFIK